MLISIQNLGSFSLGLPIRGSETQKARFEYVVYAIRIALTTTRVQLATVTLCERCRGGGGGVKGWQQKHDVLA